MKSINIFGLKQITDTSKQLEKAKIYYANWMYLTWALCNFYINKWLECSLQRPMWLVQKLHKFTYCLIKYMSFCLELSQTVCQLCMNTKDFNDVFCCRISYNTRTFYLWFSIRKEKKKKERKKKKKKKKKKEETTHHLGIPTSKINYLNIRNSGSNYGHSNRLKDFSKSSIHTHWNIYW